METTFFDPDLEQRTAEESRRFLGDLYPTQPPANAAPTEKTTRPTASPVTINLGTPSMSWESLPTNQEDPVVRAARAGMDYFRTLFSRGGFHPEVLGIPANAAPPPTTPAAVKPSFGFNSNPMMDIAQRYLNRGGNPSTIPVTGGGETIPQYVPGPFYQESNQQQTPAYYGPMMTGTVNGKQLTLPASAWIDFAKNVTPERSYYDAHPEERFYDALSEQMKPYRDMLNSLIEQNKNWAQGYGLPMNPRAAAVMRAQAVKNLTDIGQMIPHMAGIVPTGATRAYEATTGLPLKEREVAAHEAMIPIHAMDAATHRFAAEQTAKHQEALGKFINVAPGHEVITKEGQRVYQAPFAPEQVANLMHYAILGSTEKTLNGETINPMRFVGMMNMMGSRMGQGFKPITINEVPRDWVTDYVDRRMAEVKPNIKKDSDEYRKYYQGYTDLLYKGFGQ